VRLYLSRVPSPVGEIRIVTDDVALRALDFHDYSERMLRLLRTHYGEVELIERRDPLGIGERLERYFAGDFGSFAGLPLETNGTVFQRSVWTALCAIPPGTTITYGAIARALGSPAATRAVGLANGANPIAIVVPCHRVIGADGTLTGYGGGLARKAWLLRHEGIPVPDATHPAQTAFAFS
jgi:methylated-DNA-[protein]-cysteine S-methyltransferase